MAGIALDTYVWCYAKGCGRLIPTGRQTPNSLAEKHLKDSGGFPHTTLVWSVPAGADPNFPTKTLER